MTQNIIALIVAAGSGNRLGSEIPKQYLNLNGKPVIVHNIERLLENPNISNIWVVYAKEHEELADAILKNNLITGKSEGGKTRQESVFKGLQAIEHLNPDIVLIHDAARPNISDKLISEIIYEVENTGAMVVPVTEQRDSLKSVENGKVKNSIKRDNVFNVQTPQAAPYAKLFKAHKRAAGLSLSDDSAVMENDGQDIFCIKGNRNNIKITHPEDMKIMEILMQKNNDAYETRIGFGTDFHQLIEHVAGSPVEDHVIILGGLRIPHNKRLKGHSDADVVMHAVVDAMLGAIGKGDIGQHFPPSDMKWKGANSEIFIAHVQSLYEEIGANIINLDVTLIGENPKIAPYRDAIRQKLALLLKVQPTRINIKATTTERMGFTGRGEGLAAQAAVSVRYPV